MKSSYAAAVDGAAVVLARRLGGGGGGFGVVTVRGVKEACACATGGDGAWTGGPTGPTSGAALIMELHTEEREEAEDGISHATHGRSVLPCVGILSELTFWVWRPVPAPRLVGFAREAQSA